METKELQEKIDALASREEVDSLQKTVADIQAYLADSKPATEPESKPDEATLERVGVIDQAMSFKIGSIPVGQAAIGGAVSILASELVDGFFSGWQPWQRGLFKLGVAFTSGMWGRKLLGNTGAGVVALLLTFDAIRDMTPIDSWMDQLAEKITGTVTTAGLAGAQSGGKPIVTETPPTPGGGSFYSTALGVR